MGRQQVIEALRRSKPELQRLYGITRLSLFGSAARGTATPESDIDILVAFDGPATSQRFFGVQFFLEDLLGARINLVSDRAVRPELWPFIERERVDV